MKKFEAFIALEDACGIYGKNHGVNFLWSKVYGPRIFSKTMFRKDYKEIRKFLHFNLKIAKSKCVSSDKFTHI